MSRPRDYSDASTVTGLLDARRLLSGLAKKHPKRSAQLRLRLLEAQTDFNSDMIDEEELQGRIAEIVDLGTRS
ncbi:hypothetical protein EYE40_13905 [Glaciihabitans arcticus]|uniref:Uncharacterized protein n=1 Tax=Glaciihabitans arcticus TaxID=2668039 RepID=A0A4Q9GXQ3_9MICO|nr:hypothetical protein [Glaciihabitans arcticus]TBN58398.1 hypothetical protein EYE40_13905 [Glaciihabitans arcticus]